MSDFYKALKKDGASISTLYALEQLQNALPRYASEPKLGMGYGQENKYVSWNFDPREHSSIELLHITDVQFGHTECRVHRVIEYRDWVLAAPNRFMLWGGDMIDAATILSPGSPWENICGPDSQVFKFCEVMAPARHRVLGYIGGNHERRSLKTFGDAGRLIATLMRVPYSSGQQLLDIHYGKHDPFKVHLWHGTGGARTKGAKAQMIERFMHTGDAQLYLVGHLHDCILLPSIRIIRRPGKRTVHMEKIFGGMSSSFLSYWATYAEVAGLMPNDILMIRATLEPNGHWEASIR